MHPEVVSDAPGRCPECGMRLVPANVVGGGGHEHGHEGHHGHHGHGHQGHHGHGHHGHGAHHGGDQGHEAPQGIEWEDDMVEVNRMTTAEEHALEAGRPGDGSGERRNRLALPRRRPCEDSPGQRVGFRPSDAAPLPRSRSRAVPGAVPQRGRGENLVWKDTVLVRTGETVDILLDVTNPGRWMAHCHIAEHHESGMMFSFVVDAA
jgi:hypothetical protein